MAPGADWTAVRTAFMGSLGVRVRAILALGIVLGLGAVGTMALWSNSAGATSGDFKTGVVDLRVNGVKSYTFSGATGLSMTNMLPGDSRAATLQVQNTLSTLPLIYTMTARTAAGSPALTNFLRMAVFASSAPTNGTTNGLATGSCGGPQLGTAMLQAAATVPVITAAQPLGTTAETNTQNLCFVVTLVPATPLSVQSQTLQSVTLTFNATTT
ncbi:SipW-dependent-type signal peptide-containing protein [Williamsia soli]|uniref:SipW-dependent-type signal peptide-containing protein n=1 Tax=Williamsia soli TaxID=364929 RepID=UPI001A9DBC44|nr:SipW-dependent-type signal peptide-containing protein [Williamsia soli]